jgi:hypothetical protein
VRRRGAENDRNEFGNLQPMPRHPAPLIRKPKLRDDANAKSRGRCRFTTREDIRDTKLVD